MSKRPPKKVSSKGAIQKKRAAARKNSPPKARTSSPKKVDSSRTNKELLHDVIHKAIGCIHTIQKKQLMVQEKIDHQQEKMCSTKDETERLNAFVSIEGLKIDSFSHVEQDFKALSPLLDEAYLYADKIGGLIRDDFLNICQSLSKGIDLQLMEKGLEKIQKDLKKAP